MSDTPFVLDDFLTEIKKAAREADPQPSVRAILDRVFASPEAVAAALPDYAEDDVVLFEDETVSIWHCRFQPGRPVPPHNHELSANIGVYAGVETNRFYKSADTGGIAPSRDVNLGPGDVLSIGPSGIHSVECISENPSCGIHVYLGPLTKTARDLYDLSNGKKVPFTEEAYERLQAAL